MMYEALVARVRYHIQKAEFMGLKEAESTLLLKETADAIEKLDNWWEQADKLTKMLEMPRWIPVSERLPEEAGKYLVCGRWREKPTEIWVCEFITLGCVKGWANNAANPIVSYWMPLPEPPREET